MSNQTAKARLRKVTATDRESVKQRTQEAVGRMSRDCDEASVIHERQAKEIAQLKTELEAKEAELYSLKTQLTLTEASNANWREQVIKMIDDDPALREKYWNDVAGAEDGK